MYHCSKAIGLGYDPCLDARNLREVKLMVSNNVRTPPSPLKVQLDNRRELELP